MAGKPKSRCRFTNGRGRCRFPSSRGHAFCPAHAKQVERDQPLSSAEAAEILGPMEEFQSADDVNYALGQLFSLAARRQIRTRDAAILTYMCQLILQTLKPEPHPRRPPHVIVDNAAPYRAALAAKEAARKAKQDAEAHAAAAVKEEAERQAEAQAASERKAREEEQARAQAAEAEAARVSPLTDSAQYQGPRDQKPGQINDLSQWRTYRGVLR
jgi:hypothetical protein